MAVGVNWAGGVGQAASSETFRGSADAAVHDPARQSAMLCVHDGTLTPLGKTEIEPFRSDA